MFPAIGAVLGAGVAFALSVGPATAEVSKHFDMMCQGRSSTTAKGISAIEKPDNSRMSVDLDRRLWCWRKGEACFQVIAIHSVDGDIVMLRDDSDAKGDSHIRLDLADGHLASLVHITMATTPQITAALDALCTMAPYTTIP